MNVSTSPLPNDLGAPEVASIDGTADFRAPASHKNSVSSAPSTRASNTGLAGNSTVSKADKLLLSTTENSLSSTSSSSSSRSAAPPQKPPAQPQTASRKPIANTLPRAYQEVSPGAKLLQSIGKTGGVLDERQVPLPPVPTITRESVMKLQQQLSKQAEEKEKAQEKKSAAATKVLPSVAKHENFKAVRPVDREKIAQIVQNAKPKAKFDAPSSESMTEKGEEQSETKSESTATNSSKQQNDTKSEQRSNSSAENSESEYDRILREMEEECEEMDSQETVAQLNDVKFVPQGAHLIDNNSKDNRIIDMLKMFQSFIAEPPKGTRPTAQSSMFNDVDSLLAVDGATENVKTKKKTKNRRKRMQIGDSGETTSSSAPQEEEEEVDSNKSSTASFRLDSENKDLMRQKLDSNGRFTF